MGQVTKFWGRRHMEYRRHAFYHVATSNRIHRSYEKLNKKIHSHQKQPLPVFQPKFHEMRTDSSAFNNQNIHFR